MMMPKWSPTHGRRHQGLSLLELLVALAIVGMSLALLYRIMGGNAHATAEMVARQHAIKVAEAIVSAHADVPPSGWTNEGGQDGFAWRVESTPYATGLTSGTPSLTAEFPGAVQLHEVTVRVNWSVGAQAHNLMVQTLLPERKPLPVEGVSL